jgi:type I restriction enzyme S subunit
MSQAYTAITPLEKVRGEFFKYLFKCESFIHLLDSTTSQLRNGQSIRWKDLRNVSLPLPPLAEQSKIASFLDDQCGRIDELLSEINTQINLLRQYRKSLISEAVTGKIEV